MYKINSISDYHKLAGLPPPGHPLVSLVDFSQVQYPRHEETLTLLQGNYSIALKRDVEGMRYGQQVYDFNEGVMSFVAPGQVLNISANKDPQTKPKGWILLFNPDFLWQTSLANKIRDYEFFGYRISEALFLSDKEEQSMIGIMHHIKQEYQSNIDKFSQSIIIAQIELLLNYADRFYQRQFITRKISNHQILERLEQVLADQLKDENLALNGLPAVQSVALELNVSPNYLSSLLKQLTGLNTQQHIHEKLIERAKEQLSTTQLSVSEIAYSLGFEHAQSFSRLFKSKTHQSPLEFRASFN